MTVTWDPTHTYAAVQLSNGNLTALSDQDPPYGGGTTMAIQGFAANAAGPYAFVVNYDAVVAGTYETGLCLGSQDVSQRPAGYPSNNTGATAIQVTGSHIISSDNTAVYANFGSAMATGDQLEFLIQGGYLYVRVMRSGSGSWGAWNGAGGGGAIYSNATPGTSGGIPLTGFGSQALYPYFYGDTGTQVTANFASWSTPNATGAGSAAGSGSAAGVGAAIAKGTGTASGSGSARSLTPVGSAAGSGSAAGVGAAIVTATGTASGTGHAAGVTAVVPPPGTPVVAITTSAKGDQADFLARIKRLLPAGWFGRDGDAPVLDAQLSGGSWALSLAYAFYGYAKSQTRIATMTDGWLELAAGDFFDQFPRFAGEGDAAYSRRIRLEVLRDRNTRNAIDRAVYDLTGNHPDVYEGWRPGCTGGFGSPGLAYGRAGRYASRTAPAETIVTTPQLQNYGIPNRGGWGSGVGGWGIGNFSLVDDTLITGSGPTVSDLVTSVDRVRAAGTTILVQFTQAGAPETANGAYTAGSTILTASATAGSSGASGSSGSSGSGSGSSGSGGGTGGGSSGSGSGSSGSGSGSSGSGSSGSGSSGSGSSGSGSTGSGSSGSSGTPSSVVLDFIGANYTGGSLNSLTMQGSARTITDSAGNAIAVAANVVPRSDLGVFVNGQGQTFVAQQARHPIAWSVVSSGGTTTLTADTTPALSDTPNPAIYTADHTGSYALVKLLQQPAVGQPFLVKTRVRILNSAHGTGAGIRLLWNGGASSEMWYCGDLTQAQPTWYSDQTYSQTGASTTLISSQKLSDGMAEVVFQRVASTQDHEVHIRTQAEAAGQQISIGGCQITLGNQDQPWTDVGNTAVVLAADNLTATPGSNLYQIAQGAAGFLAVEMTSATHATIGTQGWPGSTAGAILQIGSQAVLKPNGPTAFDTQATSATALGRGSWRGVTRAIFTWDATGASLFVNKSKVASVPAGTFTPGGALAFLAGVTGQIRRIEAGPSRMSDTDALAWSALENRSFPNVSQTTLGSSVAAWLSKVSTTFFDDFDNGLTGALRTQSHRNFPYGTAPQMGQSYDTGPATAKWIPRKHGDQSDPHGSSPINGEHELYGDPAQAGAWQGNIQVQNSCAILTVVQTSTLTSGQQAQVPNDPSTNPAVPYQFVSGQLTTWQQFSQQFGIFSWRVKMPTFPGAWPAVWLYDPDTSAETDADESYGTNPNVMTCSFHANYFQYNNTNHINIGYNQSADFHDVTVVWVAGTEYFYYDDVLVAVQPTTGTFDQGPQYIIMNLAIDPNNQSGTPAWLAANGKGQMLIDRVSVLQFAS